jgi:predicted anti-sigma-YlaC factor YlaD
MQQFMDRVLTDVERVEAEAHLDECAYCRKRYRFEATLRVFVRQAVAAEPMSVELKRKLSELRTPLQ